MLKIFLDTNVILDAYGAASNEKDALLARRLIDAIWQRTDGFMVTAGILKDFQYIYAARLKQRLRAQKGRVTDEDAKAISAAALTALESVQGLCSVASEGMADCEMARIMCRQHDDFEDNLIAAVAKRSGADFIVTGDKAFLAHCPVACLTPADMLAHLEAGL